MSPNRRSISLSSTARFCSCSPKVDISQTKNATSAAGAIPTVIASLISVLFIADFSRAQALDFPPGQFVDSGPLHVSDFRGKILVLCFYDPALPEDWSDPQVPRWLLTNWSSDPVEPVCFVCVACGMNIEQVRADQTETPPIGIFADTWRIMEHRAGGPRPKSGRWRYTVLGPDGDVIGTPGIDAATAAERIDRTLPKSHWTYRTRHTPDRLKEAVEALEYGQFETGARLTRRALSDHDAATAQAAKDLHKHLRSDARIWNEQAAAAETTDPLSAYDTYARVAAIFPNDDLGRFAIRSMRKLENTRDVRSEIAARSAYARPRRKRRLPVFLQFPHRPPAPKDHPRRQPPRRRTRSPPHPPQPPPPRKPPHRFRLQLPRPISQSNRVNSALPGGRGSCRAACPFTATVSISFTPRVRPEMIRKWKSLPSHPQRIPLSTAIRTVKPGINLNCWRCNSSRASFPLGVPRAAAHGGVGSPLTNEGRA